MLMAGSTSPDMEVRKKCLHIALNMVTSRNVEDVVLFLKKQLTHTLDADYEKVNLSRPAVV
jgi:coatomer subunit beta